MADARNMLSMVIHVLIDSSMMASEVIDTDSNSKAMLTPADGCVLGVG